MTGAKVCHYTVHECRKNELYYGVKLSFTGCGFHEMKKSLFEQAFKITPQDRMILFGKMDHMDRNGFTFKCSY